MGNSEQLEILKQGVESWNKWRDENAQIRPDLSRADLRRADLSGANFRGTDLRRVDLSAAKLIGADLREVDFYGADLVEADLREAGLRGADIHRAKLSSLCGANLAQANLAQANLIGADLREADLREADLGDADLRDADLSQANLFRAYLNGANLNGANLSYANLFRARLGGANLSQANLSQANLVEASLSYANLTRANLSQANLSQANLVEACLMKAQLHSTDLRMTVLVGTNFKEAELTACKVYGIAAWGLQTENAVQHDLIISDDDTALITVDSIEVAQFIYLLLNNEKIRSVIDTITSKSVLILGRFTEERKAILDAIRDELRRHNYVPILFDFERPSSRNMTSTVRTLASLVRFVIVDLSDPNSAPHEVMSFIDIFRSVPVQAVFTETPGHMNPYPMYEELTVDPTYPHLLETFRYKDQVHLIASFSENIIKPLEQKAEKLKPPKFC